MYERINAPAGVVAVKLGETLTAAEIVQLYTDVGVALEKHERLHYYVDAGDWSNIGVEAMFEGLRQRLLHLGWLNRFDRVGIVTGSAFVQGAAGLFAAVVPGMQLRCFAPDSADAAFSWVKDG